MKLSVVIELLQYPGFGPISEPPWQYILVVCHSKQSPGTVGAVRRYSVSAVHSTQAPVTEKDSPVVQFLKDTDNSKSVDVLLTETRYTAFDGFVESMPVVEIDKPK